MKIHKAESQHSTQSICGRTIDDCYMRIRGWNGVDCKRCLKRRKDNLPKMKRLIKAVRKAFPLDKGKYGSVILSHCKAVANALSALDKS